MTTQRFDVVHEVPGRVVDEAGMRATAAAAALVEEDQAIGGGVEALAQARR